MSPAAPAVRLHPRTVIRKAVAALLLGKTAAGENVFTSRTGAFMSRELPAIAVYTTDEAVDDGETSPRRYTRNPDVVVQLVVEADKHLDDVLDALALEVEDILLPNPIWGGVAEDSLLIKASTFLTSDGRTDYACHELTFRAEYETRPGLLEEPSLDDFRVGHTAYRRNTPDGPVVIAEDEITLPTQTTE